MHPTSRRVRGEHDLDLHLLEWSQEGVPLLFLHGFGNEAHIWDDFAPTVAPHYRTFALDHRGHGDSAWDPERRYEHDVMVADVERVLEQLGVERFVLIGHSLGGRVATLFAGRHPERLAVGDEGVVDRDDMKPPDFALDCRQPAAELGEALLVLIDGRDNGDDHERTLAAGSHVLNSRAVWSEQLDSNQRPPRPERGALPG